MKQHQTHHHDARRALPARRIAGTTFLVGLLTSCASSPPQVNDGFVAGGTYQVTGVRVLSNGLGDNRAFTLHLSAVTATSISFEIVSGDVAHTLPAPETATGSGGSYTAHWAGNAQFSFTIVFRIGSCEGSDTGGGGDVVAWETCSIRQTS